MRPINDNTNTEEEKGVQTTPQKNVEGWAKTVHMVNRDLHALIVSSMLDDDAFRSEMRGSINQTPQTRESLETAFGPAEVFDTKQLQETFEVVSFLAPLVLVRRKADGEDGVLTFQHDPRLYFMFLEAEISRVGGLT
jgi:hypothetical protein